MMSGQVLHSPIDSAVSACDQARFSVIIPAYNEAQSIEIVAHRFRSLYPQAQIIIVDNNSNDGTRAAAERVPGVLVVTERRQGKGLAMRRGLELAEREFVLFHDADLEYDPADSASLMQLQLRHPNEMICGNRTITMGAPPWSSLAASWWIRLLLQWRQGDLCGVDVLTGSRSASKASWGRLNLRCVHFGIETEIVRQALSSRLHIRSTPVSYQPRTVRQGKKIRFFDIFRLTRVALE